MNWSVTPESPATIHQHPSIVLKVAITNLGPNAVLIDIRTPEPGGDKRPPRRLTKNDSTVAVGNHIEITGGPAVGTFEVLLGGHLEVKGDPAEARADYFLG